MDKVLSLLGLAKKARVAVSGEFSTEKAVKDRKACLVLVAEDASENTKKLFLDKCTFYKIPVRFYGTKETLGKAMGEELRSSAAVCDRGFASAIEKNFL